MNGLAKALKALASKDVDLNEVADVLEKHAQETSPQSSMRGGYEDLVQKYQRAQINSKAGPSTSKTKGKKGSRYFSLNFAKFRKQMKGLRKSTANVQVVGFTEDDTHEEVVSKGARGLDINCDISELLLVCSNGIVRDVPIFDKQWTLGAFTEQNGGSSNRSKKVWGLLCPVEDENLHTSDSGFVNSLSSKRCSERVYPPSKRKKVDVALGTTRNFPVALSSGSHYNDCDEDFDPVQLIVKYCPIHIKYLCTSIICVGRSGVWRTMNQEYAKDDASNNDMDGTNVFQPELKDFYLIELMAGSRVLLKVVQDDSEENKFILHDAVKRVVTTSRTQVLDSSNTCAMLLVLSPNHERIDYTWEKQHLSSHWVLIEVPSYTCLLYANNPGKYRCFVEEKSYMFSVTRKEIECTDGDNLRVEMKDIKFGKVIGKGSFAVVYRGHWRGKEVALKKMQLPSGSASDLLTFTTPKEVLILRNLSHPNIINLLAYVVTKEEIVLITNYVKGNNLDTLLFGSGAKELSEDQAVRFAVKVTDAVQYMHSHDPIIIHQDLKPQNVLVTTDMTGIFVCDMGIAKVKQIAERTMTSTTKGPGTYPYMAPEMFRKSHRGPAVDIYSLGCLFIELFGGKRVWPGLDGPDIMMQVLGTYDTPPSLPDMSHLKAPYDSICRKICRIVDIERPKIDEVVEMLRH